MKCGIKALLITLAIATTGMSAGALAAPPQPKRSLYRAKLTPLHRHLPKLKPLNLAKAQRTTVHASASIRPRLKISPA